MGGLTRSWALFCASWQVLLAEQGLLLFPALSAVCTVLAAVAFALPAVVTLAVFDSSSSQGLEAAHAALLFAFYLVISFVTLFFNTAMVGMALERLRGRDPRVGDGFRVAAQNLPSIFVFAIVSATVGVVLRLVEDRFELIGSIVASILGAAWSVVTFLVVPVIVVEHGGAFAAIRRSGELLRRTWGAQIAGNAGIGLVAFLLALLGLVPIALGFAVGAGAVLVGGIAVAVLYWGLVAVIASALGQIYRAAVYLYTASGTVPAQFDASMIQQAFRAR